MLNNFYTNYLIFINLQFLDAPHSVLARHQHRTMSNMEIYIPKVPKLSNKQKIQKAQRLFNKSFDANNYINSVNDINDVELMEQTETTNDSNNFLNNLFETSDFKLNDYTCNSLSDTEFFKTHVLIDIGEALQISNFKQLTNDWKSERKLRITASKCYELFTYSNTFKTDEQWTKKIKNFLNPKQFVTKPMQYGIDTEKIALASYVRDTEANVVSMGLVVHPSACWLGGSPDGVDIENKVLIEIKCPNLGITLNLNDLKVQLSYLDENFELKSKHIYYGQVQLNMFILNLKLCHFLIYSKVDDKCLCVQVTYDENFVRNKMIPKLMHTYFTRILPILNSNK